MMQNYRTYFLLVLGFAMIACTPASERGTQKALGNVGSIIKTGTDQLFTTPKGGSSTSNAARSEEKSDEKEDNES